MQKECILALDLGTTSFKAAPADPDAVLGPPTVVRYRVDYTEDGVTCPPERYYQSALKALRGAARTAHQQGLTIRAIGVSSQAQTFLTLDKVGNAVQPAVVWIDTQATSEAKEAGRALPDFACTGGFLRPSPLQFLPKVMRFQWRGRGAHRFLLLNEWLVYRLTGEAYGDETNQGMGGFYDIARRTWSVPAMALANIGPENLAQIAPAAGLCARLKPDVARALDLPELPVYSCGNDQSCAAIGAGLEQPGDILCNFGTALVIYTLKDRPVAPTREDQIAGISPLTFASPPTAANEGKGSWFLLGLESECGNLVDWMAKLLYPRRSVAHMIETALKRTIPAESLPRVSLKGGGKLDLNGVSAECDAAHLARALLEYYADRFGEIWTGVAEPGKKPNRIFAGGGLSQSDAWLDLLSQRYALTFERTTCEHPALVGIARILARRETPWNTASNT